MAELIIKKFQCDRCGKVEDDKPSHVEAFRVSVCHELEWAGGKFFEWKELCADCNSDVEKAVHAMRRDAEIARAALKK